MKVVKDNLELNTRNFKINETVFTIVGTILNDGSPDTVFNMTNGKNKKYTRLDIKEMIEQFNAIGL